MIQREGDEERERTIKMMHLFVKLRLKLFKVELRPPGAEGPRGALRPRSIGSQRTTSHARRTSSQSIGESNTMTHD